MPEKEPFTEEQYKEMSRLYNSGLRLMTAYLENERDFMVDSTTTRKIINSIESRIKSYDSIMEKCERKGYEKDVETIANVIHDFAGIRITTLYRDYIEQIRDMILSHPSIELIEEKDYIENPKNNGYRSLHLIVSCHTRYNGMTKSVPVEIQIRSEAQNFQAVIEHDLCYKGDVPTEVAAEMFAELADYLSIIDDKIIELRNRSKHKS